jgi:hypothetical protein
MYMVIAWLSFLLLSSLSLVSESPVDLTQAFEWVPTLRYRRHRAGCPISVYRLDVAAGGVLFTVAGRNALDAIYPNLSIFWYWNKTGKVIMR